MKKLSCLALVGVLAAAGAPPLSAEIIEQILVKVNGEIITKTELEERQVAALRQQLRGRTLSAEDMQSDEAIRRALAEITPQVVLNAVNELVIMQRGRELGYRMTDERFSEIVRNIRKEHGLESDDEWHAALEQDGLSLDELRTNIEQQMIINALQQQEVFGRVSISEAEARKYYDEHRDEFTSPETVTLREILVTLPEAQAGRPADPATVQAAAEKLEQVQARLEAEDDFGEVAADLSDAASRANAGLIGPLRTNELSARVQELLSDLEPGDATEALETDRGWHIIKLESRNTTRVTSFDEARDEIDQRIFEARHQDEFQKYLARLRSQAIIEWKNDEVKRAYDQALSQLGRAGQPASDQPPPGQTPSASP